jgi:hypothetical protein
MNAHFLVGAGTETDTGASILLSGVEYSGADSNALESCENVAIDALPNARTEVNKTLHTKPMITAYSTAVLPSSDVSQR